MRTITLEEHFATPRFLDGPGRDLKEQAEKFNNARARSAARAGLAASPSIALAVGYSPFILSPWRSGR